jgi:hypothetical protein
MRKAILSWLFAMVLATASNNVAQTAAVPSEPPRYTLVISAVHSTVKAGAKVTIEIAMKNTSDKPMALHAEIEDYGFMVDVTVVGGGPALDTDRGHQWKHDQGMRQSSSGPGFMLKPGETDKGPLTISDLYDFSRPGKYSVQVRRGIVKSNTIIVTVAP